MPKYIECKSAINRIKEYASDVYGIDLDDAKQFSGDSLTENYCEGLYEATELVDDIPAANVAPIEALERLRDELCEQDLITMEGLKRLNTLIGKYTTVHDGGADHEDD